MRAAWRNVLPLQRLGIQERLSLIMFVVILLSLLSVSIANVVQGRQQYTRATIEELEVLARVIADRTTAAVVFNDPSLAEENLAALAIRSTIQGACAYNAEGELVAKFQRDPILESCNAYLGWDASRSLPDYIDIVTGIMLDGERVGEIHVRSDLSALQERLDRILVFTIIVAAVATVIILGISRRLQHWFTQPVLALSEQARRVARDGDYSVRAQRQSDDEFGVLVDAFNGMLETIERQNRTLMDTNIELEKRVTERTDELRAAQASLLRQERLATLGQLTGTVSHELRNPLGTIQASIDVLRRRLEDCPDDMERTLERITRNIHRCENIINELLDYSRGSQPHVQLVQLNPWLEEVLEGYIDNSDVRISMDIQPELCCELDPERMRRALTNLLDNAIHALTEPAQMPVTSNPRIHIEAARRQDDLLLCVTDNGPGIPAAVRERIFEPLFSTRSFGVGLGLAIVEQIVEQHGGRVELISEEGEGTRVSLYLPLTFIRKHEKNDKLI